MGKVLGLSIETEPQEAVLSEREAGFADHNMRSLSDNTEQESQVVILN